VDLISGDIAPLISRETIVRKRVCYFLAHPLTYRHESPAWQAAGSALKKFAPSEQRQYPLMKRLTARTERRDDRHCGHYQKYFLYLSPITGEGFCGSPWVWKRGSPWKLPGQVLWNGTSIGRTCLHPRSKPNKGHVRHVLWSIPGKWQFARLHYVITYSCVRTNARACARRYKAAHLEKCAHCDAREW